MTKIPLEQANIIQLLGIESLPLEKRQEIVESATELVETRTLAKILESLTEDQRKELETILATEDADKVSNFFESNGIDYMAIVEEEILKVKGELSQVSLED